MILNDGRIEEMILQGNLGSDKVKQNAVQPASLDLHLGPQIKMQYKTGRSVSLNNPPQFDTFEIDNTGFCVYPGHFYLAHTTESLEIPDDIAGELTGKSTWGRMGLSIHSCAGWIDPGFKGQITLEMKVDGLDPVQIYRGDPIAQIVFHQLAEPALRPYGPARKSRYYGQQGAREMVVR